jgi:uncharacterized membrane protein
MHAVMLFFHVAAAIAWMGGMVFMLAVLRPSLGTLDPPQRLKVMTQVCARFFAIVGASVIVLLLSGGWMLAASDAPPRGWHAMAVIGVVMMLIFGYIVVVPWRDLKEAVAREAWPAGGKAATQIATLAKVNLVLGTVAIAAVVAWH